MPASTSQGHKGWYSRGYLPHLDEPDLVQGITYRLHDSMPVARRVEWGEFVRLEDLDQRRERIEAYLNAGYGSCHLRDPRVAEMVQENLLHFDGLRYRLLAWVIMPNHVHVLVETIEGHILPEVVHTWKSYTAHRARELVGGVGYFWHRDYFDRYVRDQHHLERAIAYVHDNPVKAGLAHHPEDWLWSSARWLKGDADGAP